MSRKVTRGRKPKAPSAAGRGDERAGEPRADRRQDAVRGPVPPAEDFAARRDIETADEPAEEHDRRYHDDARPA